MWGFSSAISGCIAICKVKQLVNWIVSPYVVLIHVVLLVGPIHVWGLNGYIGHAVGRAVVSC